MAVETTGEMVRRLLSVNDQRKLAAEGLVVVRRIDLDAQLQAYNLVKEQNKQLRQKLAKAQM